jgi:hypothetical protein
MNLFYNFQSKSLGFGLEFQEGHFCQEVLARKRFLGVDDFFMCSLSALIQRAWILKCF